MHKTDSEKKVSKKNWAVFFEKVDDFLMILNQDRFLNLFFANFVDVLFGAADDEVRKDAVFAEHADGLLRGFRFHLTDMRRYRQVGDQQQDHEFGGDERQDGPTYA